MIPFPYSYPCVGSGIMPLVAASNIFDTRADVIAATLTGEIGGSVLQLADVFVMPDYLFLNGYSQKIDRIAIQDYFNFFSKMG